MAPVKIIILNLKKKETQSLKICHPLQHVVVEYKKESMCTLYEMYNHQLLL